MKLKKPNLIIGKKQVILASLTLMLGIAVYINYVFSNTDTELKSTGVMEGTSLNYGSVMLVNNETDNSDYFAQARIDKMTARDTAVETLQLIVSGGDTTEDEQAVATQKATAMSELIASENTIESLVKAAGFEDCVCYLDGESASIVVKTEGLIPSQCAQIKDILLNEVFVENENIRIYEVS